jgi:serine/threonine-protein kinase
MSNSTAQDLPPGALLALRYRIGPVLGRGGMGVVYRAHHLALGRDVALKVVPPGIGDRASTVRFEREARNAARLDHPGCVRVLDVGTTPDGLRFLAMDLLDGPTLRSRMQAPMPAHDAAWMTARILDALDHAHGRGVLHRDVKPENIVLVRGQPVLIDFGLSWAMGDAHVTRAGTTVGSPSYLAPERALGQDGDHRVDVYAMGVILYEMIAGRKPFAAATPVQLAWMHAHRDAPPLPSVAPGAPLALSPIVHRALAKDPATRPSAGEMARTLDALKLHAAATVAAVDPMDEESTALMWSPRSRVRDLVGRLRYGRWRWRPA